MTDTPNKYLCTRCGGTGAEPEAVPADQMPDSVGSDLVKRLRADGPIWSYGVLLSEAADRIERLEAALRDISEFDTRSSAYAWDMMEIAREVLKETQS